MFVLSVFVGKVFPFLKTYQQSVIKWSRVVDCGLKKLYFYRELIQCVMSTFIGDFICKADAKGRIVLPSLFKKAMVAMEESRFVVRKDLFEECLILSPYPDWEEEMRQIREKVNMYNRAENKFYRQYFRGAAEVSFDGNGRLLIPRRLLEKIDLPKEMVLVGVDNKIELWSKSVYEGDEMSDGELALLAERILGGSDKKDKEAE